MTNTQLNKLKAAANNKTGIILKINKKKELKQEILIIC